jgi:MFS family permease
MNIVLVQHVSESGHMGTAIGIAQVSTSVMGSIAPALASALFSISLERQLAGGDMVFYLLMGLSVLAMRLSHLLPPRVIAKSRPS